jgi:hypothetical protein
LQADFKIDNNWSFQDLYDQVDEMVS